MKQMHQFHRISLFVRIISMIVTKTITVLYSTPSSSPHPAIQLLCIYGHISFYVPDIVPDSTILINK